MSHDNQSQQQHHHGIHFTLDGERYVAEEPRLTPDHILCHFGRRDPDKYALIEVKESGDRVSFAGKGHEPIDLHNGEQFVSVHHHPAKEIRFFLDAEEYETTDRFQTPNDILKNFGKKDPQSFYLVEVKPDGERKSFQGKGDETIEIHHDENFVTVKVGPTPVSDVPPNGLDVFAAGMTTLGFMVEIVDRSVGRLKFAYVVDLGTHAGKTVTLGFDVPKTFPIDPPGGPHVSPQIHGGKAQGTVHPTSNIHASPFGGDFEYWSRPYPSWQTENSKTAATYMAYIRQLWATQ